MTGPGSRAPICGPVDGGGGINVNVAVHVNADAGIANDAAHGDGDHPAKVEPCEVSPAATRSVPWRTIPPPVAVPLPVPAIATVRGYVAGGGAFLVNVAVHVNGAAGMMKDAAHGDGDHPVNVESAAGAALSDTAAPAA